jgi:nucleoid DNA-binding protein
MDITSFLRELLFGHDCVIVPGFGGFIGNYSPARIDKADYTFYPPVKQISFNRNINHNDGLLAGKISDSLKVNYGDARNIIDDFVQSVRKKLEKGEKVTFDKIGSFTLNHEGSMQFEPDTAVNYHLDSYGLETFQFQPLESYDVRKRITRHINGKPVSNRSVRKILWRAAVIVPLVGLLIAVPLKTDLFKATVENSTMNPLATVEFEANRKALDEANTAQYPVAEKEVSSTESVNPAEVIITEVKPAISEIQTQGSYCIITGSFKAKENAETQVRMLEREGFTPEIISASNGFFRVSAERCATLNEALGRKENISGKFPGSWVKKI